jgi:hypothetical protein
MWLEPSPSPTPSLSPSPSSIDVHVTVSVPPIIIPPDTALDTYTGVLAAATMVLAAFTIALAIIGYRALRQQGREIGHLARQTSAAVEAAFPYLRLDNEAKRVMWELNGQQTPTWRGKVRAVGGSAPARLVDVWVRDMDHLYYARLGVLLPREARPFAATPGDALATQCPLGVITGETFNDQFRVWIGIVWECPDDSDRYNLYAIQRNAQWEAQQLQPDRRDPTFQRRPERA